MFCVTQISTFQFGFKRCQVAWRKKTKKTLRKGDGIFKNKVIAHKKKKANLPHGNVSAPVKCFLVCLSPGAKQSGNY